MPWVIACSPSAASTPTWPRARIICLPRHAKACNRHQPDLAGTKSLMSPSVVAVAASAQHTFTKPEQLFVNLLAGLGIEGDAHAGATVMHRYERARNPSTPNSAPLHLSPSDTIA